MGSKGVTSRIPTVKLKIPGKAFLKSETRTSVTFKLQFLTLAINRDSGWSKHFLYFSQFFHGSVLAKSQFFHWEIAKVKNYNLDVTKVRDPDFKNDFSGIFNFTVGILILEFFLSRLISGFCLDQINTRFEKLKIRKIGKFSSFFFISGLAHSHLTI